MDNQEGGGEFAQMKCTLMTCIKDQSKLSNYMAAKKIIRNIAREMIDNIRIITVNFPASATSYIVTSNSY